MWVAAFVTNENLGSMFPTFTEDIDFLCYKKVIKLVLIKFAFKN